MRTVDNSCLTMPTEGVAVIGVSAVGPSGRKAWYSNYGLEQTDVSAPGGDALDFPGTSAYLPPENRILGPTSEISLLERGFLDPDGTPNTPHVRRGCDAARCWYWVYDNGTSMASRTRPARASPRPGTPRWRRGIERDRRLHWKDQQA